MESIASETVTSDEQCTIEEDNDDLDGSNDSEVERIYDGWRVRV
jgi:hypothetical protein